MGPPTHLCATQHGYDSLTTRPGTAVHRRHYASVPRIVPASSDLLLPPDEHVENIDDGLYVSGRKRRRKRRKGMGRGRMMGDREEGQGMEEGMGGFGAMARRAWRQFPVSSAPPVPFGVVGKIVHDWGVVQSGDTNRGVGAGVSGIPGVPMAGVASNVLEKPNNRDSCRGNPLTTLPDPHTESGVLILPKASTLDSITAYTLDDVTGGTGLTRYASCLTHAEVIANVREKVFHLDAVPHDDTMQAALLAATANTLSLGRVSPGYLTWLDHLHVPSLRSATLNPLHPDEFAVLSTDGLFCGTSDDYRPESDNWHDVQSVAPSGHFRQVVFSAHPRTLLLASRRQLLLHDVRVGRAQLELLQLREAALAREGEIGALCRAPDDTGFRIILTTRAKLAYYDIRRVDTPLLDWSLVLPTAPDMIAASGLDPDAFRSDIILLASSRRGYTDVFHALHTADRAELSPFHGLLESDMFALPTQEIAWSDAPVSVATTRPYQDCVDGLAVIRGMGDRGAGVLQWSNQTGLAIHSFEVTFREDGDEAAIETCSRSHEDNSVNLGNSIWSLGPFNKRGCTCDQYPVTRSKPGSYLHSRLRRLLLRDVKEVRNRICREEDDDEDADGTSRIPRPFMRDLFREEKSSPDSKSIPSTPDKMQDRQSSSHSALPPKDDPTDGETDIGEAALLKSPESEDSDDPEGGSTDFLDAIGSGCLFDELSRSARSGFGHNPMPLGIAALKEAVMDSPLTNYYEPVWHATCDALHDTNSTAVTTAESLPSWMCTTVYYMEEAEKSESRRASAIPDSSQYGTLLARMQKEFFE